jgi:hypothetical protein
LPRESPDGGRAAASRPLNREGEAANGVAPGASSVGARNETQLERYDRNLTDLLGELRVALPGVQVLFAFLLVVPFNQRFGGVSGFERGVFLATLLLTLLACILLIAPTIIHRIHFGLGEKAYVVRTANSLMIAGLAVFALAMTCAVLLVTHYLFGTVTSVITTGFVVCGFGAVWFAVPMRNRRVCRRNGVPRSG